MDTELLRLSLADGLTLLDEDRLSLMDGLTLDDADRLALWLGEALMLRLALRLGLLDGTDT